MIGAELRQIPSVGLWGIERSIKQNGLRSMCLKFVPSQSVWMLSTLSYGSVGQEHCPCFTLVLYGYYRIIDCYSSPDPHGRVPK